jgi:hypothetical protein
MEFMAKLFLSGFGLLIIMILITKQVAANAYPPPIKISPSSSGKPDINDAGEIVWAGSYDGHQEIFLYDGSAAHPLVTYPSVLNNKLPKINSKRQVAWEGYDTDSRNREIFLYSEGVIRNISNTAGDDFAPEINDAGQVIWRSVVDGKMVIYRYSDGVTQQISTATSRLASYHYRINNIGQVVWEGYNTVDPSTEIFLYSDGEVKNISNKSRSDWSPEINNLGQVVWGAFGNYGGDIYMYSNGVAQNFTNSDGINESNPRINDAGEMVWFVEKSSAWNEDEILFFSGGVFRSISKVTHSSYNELSINNMGQVVWWDYNPNFANHDLDEINIYLYSKGNIQKISRTGKYNKYPKINNGGQIVFANDSSIFLANPLPGSAEINVLGMLYILLLN